MTTGKISDSRGRAGLGKIKIIHNYKKQTVFYSHVEKTGILSITTTEKISDTGDRAGLGEMIINSPTWCHGNISSIEFTQNISGQGLWRNMDAFTI